MKDDEDNDQINTLRTHNLRYIYKSVSQLAQWHKVTFISWFLLLIKEVLPHINWANKIRLKVLFVVVVSLASNTVHIVWQICKYTNFVYTFPLHFLSFNLSMLLYCPTVDKLSTQTYAIKVFAVFAILTVRTTCCVCVAKSLPLIYFVCTDWDTKTCDFVRWSRFFLFFWH